MPEFAKRRHDNLRLVEVCAILLFGIEHGREKALRSTNSAIFQSGDRLFVQLQGGAQKARAARARYSGSNRCVQSHNLCAVVRQESVR